jgi:hypothetical protein
MHCDQPAAALHLLGVYLTHLKLLDNKLCAGQHSIAVLHPMMSTPALLQLSVHLPLKWCATGCERIGWGFSAQRLEDNKAIELLFICCYICLDRAHRDVNGSIEPSPFPVGDRLLGGPPPQHTQLLPTCQGLVQVAGSWAPVVLPVCSQAVRVKCRLRCGGVAATCRLAMLTCP